MRRVLRSTAAALLAVLIAVPAHAQTQAESTVPRAVRGELVIVSPRDGHSVTGEVGPPRKDGFYVYPSNPSEPGVLVHTADIEAIRSATTGAPRDLPSPTEPHKMSKGNKVALGIAIGVGVPIAIAIAVCAQYPKGCMD